MSKSGVGQDINESGFWRAICDGSAAAIGIFSTGKLLACNTRWEQMFGGEVGLSADTWLVNPESQRAVAAGEQAARLGVPSRVRVHMQRSDGMVASVNVRIVTVGSYEAWYVRDARANDRERNLLRCEERFKDLLALTVEWYWEQDREQRFMLVTDEFSTSSGLPVEAIVGRRLWEVQACCGLSEARWREHREMLDSRLPFKDFVFQVRTPVGDMRWVSISGKPIFDERGEFSGYHGVGLDATHWIERADAFKDYLTKDPLTGLPNRHLYLDRFNVAIAHARRAHRRTVGLVVELDNFRTIFKSCGAVVADSVLAAAAQRMHRLVRETDTVARLSDDVFAILLPDVAELLDGEQFSQRLLETLQEPLAVDGVDQDLRVSIGIAAFPEHGSEARELLEKAEKAMAAARIAGGVYFKVSEH